MKLLKRIFLFAGIFICMQQNTIAQDLFLRFEKRLGASMQKPEVPALIIKQKKRKGVAKISSEFKSDRYLLLNNNLLVPYDSLAQIRWNEKGNHPDSDSMPKETWGSISKKKKKNKQEDLLHQHADSTVIDSLTQQKFIDEESKLSLGDTIQEPTQVLIMDSAFIFLYANKFDTAVIYFTKVVENFPTTDEYKLSFLWRAKAKSGLNDFAGALHDLEIFISLDNCMSQWCSESFYQRALVNFKMEHYDEAILDFTKTLTDSTFNNFKYCYFYRALCLGESGKYIQAVQDYTKFLNLDKFKSVSSAEALYYRGFYKVKLNDNRGAISDYNLAIEMYSGAYESSKGKNQIYFQKLIDTYITRGLANAEIKKWDDAIDSYNTVIKMKPDYALAYHLKGLSEIGKGDLDAGCLNLSKAGELGSNEAYNDIKLHCK